MMGEAAIEWEGPLGLEDELAQLRRGDPEALGALLARYQNRVFRYLLRLVRETATAEDLFQQTWLRVAEKIGRYDPRRSFEAWLFSIAHHLAIDHFRRHRPESLDEPLESGATVAEKLPAATPGALETLLSRERSSRLARALDHLPAIYREVLTLRFEEEMKIEDIAAVLDASLSTVKTRLRRGLEALRKLLEATAPERDWR